MVKCRSGWDMLICKFFFLAANTANTMLCFFHVITPIFYILSYPFTIKQQLL